MRRHRIQPKVTVELETVTLRLPTHLVRAVEQYAKYLGGSTDRIYVITQAIEIALRQGAEFQKTLSADPAAPLARRVCHRVAAVPTHLQNTVVAGGAQPAPPASRRITAVFPPALSADLAGPSPVTLR